jgi:hypothetical protein
MMFRCLPSPSPQVVPAEQQQAALSGILRVLTDDGPNGLSPQPLDLPYMLEKDGMCTGLYQYCLARHPSDVMTVVDDGRKTILQMLFHPTRLERLRQGAWVLDALGQDALTPTLLFETVTEGLWGTGLAASDRVLVQRNWGMQLYWVELLLQLAAADERELPRDVATVASGELFRLYDSIQAELQAADATRAAARPLLRTVLVKLRANDFVPAG